MINKFKRMNYVQRLSLAFLLLVLLCKLGGLTWAWLCCEDSVTNVFGMHDYFLDIVLSEPNWNNVGYAQAHKMQPGMDIFKDPRVTDITEDDCFVRMKIIVADTSGNEITDKDKKEAILKAINYCTSDGNTPEVDDDVFSYYPNLNPEFYYNTDDGWFYYIDSSTAKNTSPTCAILKSGATTSPLFTDVLIPAKKAEYNKYFAGGFYITVVAEGVYTGGATEDNISVADIKKRFDGEEEAEEETESTSESESSSGSENSDNTDNDKNDSTNGENSGSTNGDNSGGTNGDNSGGTNDKNTDGTNGGTTDDSTNVTDGTGAGVGGGTSGNISDEPGDEDSIISVQSSARKSGLMIAISNSSFGIDDALVDGSADVVASGGAVGTEVK